MYQLTTHISKTFLMLSTMAIFGFTLAMPQWAEANSGAGATILNVATVNYKDASGTTSYAETATSTVTINLVAAAPTVSAPVDLYTASNGTSVYTYEVTANANGSDTYNISAAETAATNTAGAATVTTSVASLPLGASVIAAVPAANQISVPAGTDMDTYTAVGDILVIGGVDYAVSVITTGTAASHANVSTTDGLAGITTAETSTVITLIANAAGSNTAPAFGAGNVGTQVGERGTFTVSVTATVGAAPGDGTSTVGTTVGTAAVDETITTFEGANLTITKEVSTDGGATFAASGIGAPGDTLTYRITVVNAGAGSATTVIITDPMPAYTTYTAGTAKLDTTAAPVTYAVAATGLTDAAGGDTYDFGVTTANTATHDAGTVAAAARVVLFYQVTID